MRDGNLNGAVLDRLYEVIQARKGGDPETSHTARLFQKGVSKIAQKVGEEAVETVIEGVAGEKEKIAAESADLLYHLLVLWAERDVAPAEVWAALEGRRGTSGIRREGGAPGRLTNHGSRGSMPWPGIDENNIFRENPAR